MPNRALLPALEAPEETKAQASAFAGVKLTGLGYSLVYPGFGVEALRRAPAESRGLAMGAFTAFLGLSLGLTGPALGRVAGRIGLDWVFLASTLVVLCSVAIAARLVYVRIPRNQSLCGKTL